MNTFLWLFAFWVINAFAVAAYVGRRIKDTEGFTLRIVRPYSGDSQVIGLDSSLVCELAAQHGKDGIWRFPLTRSEGGHVFADLDVVICPYTLRRM
jgi:hypothetical protein